jgi:hypothetical protein
VLHVLEGNEHEPFIRDSGDVVDVVLDFVDGWPLRSARRRVPSGRADAALAAAGLGLVTLPGR